LFPGPKTEDCLTLNVYAPKVPAPGDPLLPVLVFIHGGAWVYGSGVRFDGRRLLNRDIVYVSINYRLGMLGYLCLGTDDAPGNAGLYDQILALKWVNQFIKGFGGDPTKITISGESAGSVSVRNLQDSPLAAGLFRGAIASSGDSLTGIGIQSNPINGGLAAAASIGCYNNGDSVSQVVSCLSGLTPAQILQANASFQAAPCVQDFTLSTEKALPLHPRDSLKGNQARVPLMLGTNLQDGSFFASGLYSSFVQPSGILNNAEYMKYQFLPDILNGPSFGISDSVIGLHDTLLDTYLGARKYSGVWSKIVPGIIDLFSVFYFKAPAFETAKTYSASADTFLYSFDYIGEQTFYPYVGGVPEVPGGAAHGDDLVYLFHFGDFNAASDKQMSVKMIQLYTNFVTNLNPNGPLLYPDWPKHTRDNGIFYKINATSSIGSDYVGYWAKATRAQ